MRSIEALGQRAVGSFQLANVCAWIRSDTGDTPGALSMLGDGYNGLDETPKEGGEPEFETPPSLDGAPLVSKSPFFEVRKVGLT